MSTSPARLASKDLPLKNPIQNYYGGGEDDCFVAKFSSAGGLLFSTYLGSIGLDTCKDLAIAPDGIVIAASSNSAEFPLKNASQTSITPRTGFSTPALVKLALDGSGIMFSTFFGGPTAGGPWAVALDPEGNIYTAGGVFDDAFITKDAFQARRAASGNTGSGFLAKFDPTAHNLIYSTYFGGSGDSAIGRIAVDADGSVYVAGSTYSADFPVKNSFGEFSGKQDCFVAKFAPGGNTLVYSTLFGGSDTSSCWTLAIDSAGNAYFGGPTTSSILPVRNAFQQNYGGGYDGFFGKVSDNTPLPASPLTPASGRVSFQYVQGAGVPAEQTVAVAGPTFTVLASAGWLSARVAAAGVVVAINPANLAPGTYSGSITLSPPTGTPATIDVALTVLAPAPTLTSVDPPFIPLNSDDTVVVLHGSGFKTGATIQVNTQPWTSTPVQVVDTNTIRVLFPKPVLIFDTTWTITATNPQSAVSNVVTLAVGTPAPYFIAGSVTNAASYATGPVAPGEIVTIFGTNLVSTVTFDNIPATLIYSSPVQVSVTVPYLISGPTTTLRVGTVPVVLDVAPAAPGIFAAVVDRGYLILYATGCGATDWRPVAAVRTAGFSYGERAICRGVICGDCSGSAGGGEPSECADSRRGYHTVQDRDEGG